MPLRTVWSNEASSFTPWLARDENLKFLGDSIGMELVLEAQEQPVGPFRADILCKEATSGNWVLIENQIERTDHTHLGQLITYAAGLHAVTIVWVASLFTDEHRAALDWLNEVTPTGISFFGLEVELWRIGDSAPAPKFNLVSKPNAWTKAGEQVKQNNGGGGTNYGAYWAALGEYLGEHGGDFPPRRSSTSNWVSWSMGRGDVMLACLVSAQKRQVAVRLSCLTETGLPNMQWLTEFRSEIDAQCPALEWDSKPGRKEHYVGKFLRDADVTDIADWERQFGWVLQTLRDLKAIFAPYVAQMPKGPQVPTG